MGSKTAQRLKEERAAHRKARKERKRRSGLRRREVDTRSPRVRFLIVCEGAKTEPNYFRSFRVKGDVQVVGAGAMATTVVQRAIELQRQARKDGMPYDRVWCVFDRDPGPSNPAKNFNRALQLAQDNTIAVAYSNEAFELWFLLHFDYIDSALSRDSYQDRLGEQLGAPYRKNDSALYHRLQPLQAQALRNAERLLSCYASPNPERDNPSTTVHLLVKELNTHAAP